MQNEVMISTKRYNPTISFHYQIRHKSECICLNKSKITYLTRIYFAAFCEAYLIEPLTTIFSVFSILKSIKLAKATLLSKRNLFL